MRWLLQPRLDLFARVPRWAQEPWMAQTWPAATPFAFEVSPCFGWPSPGPSPLNVKASRTGWAPYGGNPGSERENVARKRKKEGRKEGRKTDRKKERRKEGRKGGRKEERKKERNEVKGERKRGASRRLEYC